MEMILATIEVAACSVFMTWVIIECCMERRRNLDDEETQLKLVNRRPKVLSRITVLSNSVVSIFYLGFLVYEIWEMEELRLPSVFLSITWIMVTLLVVYCKRKTGESNRWPLVLVVWWVIFCIWDILAVSVYAASLLKQLRLPPYLPLANFSYFASLPFSVFLCFNALAMRCNKPLQELRQPLLSEENACSNKDAFTNAGIWSHLTFSWLNPLFEIGRKQKLELSRVPLVPESESAEKSFSSLEEAARKQKAKDLSLQNALLSAIFRPLATNAIFAGLNTFASYVGPLLITNFVNFISGKDENSGNSYGYMLAFLFFLAKTVESLSQRQWYFGARRIGIRVRSALMVSIYSKSLLSRHSGMSDGKTANFLNVDVERIGDFCWYIHQIWLLPFQITLAVIILYRNLGGAASFAALFATVLVMVGNIPLASAQERLHSKIMEAKDSRIKATSETLKSMRILKLQAWETAYMEKLLKLRGTEGSWLKRYLYTCSAVAFLFWTSPTLVSLVTFCVCILVKVPLTSGAVLSALATFRILQEPIYNLPELVSMTTQTKVSIDRIEYFLREETPRKITHNLDAKTSDVAIEIEVGEYRWNAESNLDQPTIKINKKISIMKGQKVAICGSVGSGKSSLLSGIIDEIPRTYGAAIKVFGSKAYVPQSAWIQTGSVQENVLFGKKMDKSFYEDVLVGCALGTDIKLWRDGDRSIIGERGMNLSGGQKQRIQLARAIYSDSEIYLLDDPFSAVDAHTGSHLFKECLMKLLAGKTVIYVTHQLEFLDSADLVLVMKDGEIIQSGEYEELMKDTNGELVRQVAAHNQSLIQVTPPQDHGSVTYDSHQRQLSELEEETQHACDTNSRLSERIHEEERESGRVKWQVYSAFITSAYKGALVPVILLCHILFQGLQIASNYWIAWATEREQRVSKVQMMGVFVLLSGGSSFFVLGRAVLLSTIALETSRRLFVRMTASIFHAPISFFDTTPSSRILNRSSTDQSTVDTDIPYRVAGLAFALIQLLSIIILMSLVAWHIFLFFLAILMHPTFVGN
ncbi:hypothetical protein ACLOJK_008295 [Asimina triloba]